MELIFLGTGASVPSESRNASSMALIREGETLLFDCGEGTQLQMMKAHLGFRRKMKVFITHMHGDHTLGLLGLIQTMSLFGRESELQVYGPPTLSPFLASTLAYLRVRPRFPLRIGEVTPGIILEENKYIMKATRADHFGESFSFGLIEKERPGKFDAKKARAIGIPEGPIRSLIQQGKTVTLKDGTAVSPGEILGPPRSGRKIVYSGDTRSCDEIVKLAKGADLLIHEATFDDSLAEEASEMGHSTSTQAAEIARKAGVRRLILTHISARYQDPQLLLSQAKAIFPDVEVAEDLQRLMIPLRRSSEAVQT